MIAATLHRDYHVCCNFSQNVDVARRARAVTAQKFRAEKASLAKMREFRALPARVRNCSARPAGPSSPGERARRGRLGGRQIRNEFFCFEHPAKGATREKTIPDCYPTVVSRGESHGEPRRDEEREQRGPFASAKPFLQPCMQPPRESQTRHTYTRGRPCV